MQHCKEGRDAFTNAKAQLIEYGYLKRVKQNTKEDGTFAGCDYNIYETPITENPYTDNPSTENPCTNNIDTSNTRSNKYKEKEKNKKEKEELTSPNGFDFDAFFLSFKKGWQEKCNQPSTDGVDEFVVWNEEKEGQYKNLLRNILYKQGTDTDSIAKAILKQIKVYQKYFEYKHPTRYRNTIESLLINSYWTKKYELPKKAQEALVREQRLEEFNNRKDKFDLHYGEAGQKIKQAILQDKSIFEFWNNKSYLKFIRASHDWLVKIEGGELVWACENQFNDYIDKYITKLNKSSQVISIINQFVS
jgi:hypothetical protein